MGNMPYRYIYEIVNTVNGHTYVGQRTSTCLPSVEVYWGSGILIKRAIKKYGLSLFEKRILEVVLGDKRLLDAREKYWIKERKAGGHAEYNIAPGGTGGGVIGRLAGAKGAGSITLPHDMRPPNAGETCRDI